MSRTSLAVLFLVAPLALLACNKSSDTAADTKENADKSGEAGGSSSPTSDSGKSPGQTCPATLTGDIRNDIVINEGCGEVAIEGTVTMHATLTLEPGARLVAADGAELLVGYGGPGKLISKGSSEAPVTITSKGDKAPGVWAGVHLGSEAARSQIDGLVLEYAGADEAPALRISAPDVTIGSLTVRHSKGPAVDIEATSATALASLSVEQVGAPALRTTAAAASGVVAVAGEGAEAHIVAGNFERDGKLAAIGVPWVFTYEAHVGGDESHAAALTVAAGASLRFTESGSLTVGYSHTGKLVLAGEPGKEIQLGSARAAEAGAWRGLWIGDQGTLDAKHVKIGDAGRDEGAAVHADNKAKVTLDNAAISNSSIGIQAADATTTLALGNTSFSAVPVAIEAHPVTFAGVGAGNSYDASSRIVVLEGTVEQALTWTAQPTIVELRGNLGVDNEGKLVVPGGKYQAADGVMITVGYSEPSTLELRGSAEQPVEIAATRDEPQLWGPITINNSSASVLEHVVLRSATEPAGVVVDGEANVKIAELRCDRCAATLQWSCEAKLDKSNVSAGIETASAELAPEDCG